MLTRLKMYTDERWWLFKGEAREEVGHQVSRRYGIKIRGQLDEQISDRIWNQLGQPVGTQLWVVTEWARRQLTERYK